jgi:hypothetical protein
MYHLLLYLEWDISLIHSDLGIIGYTNSEISGLKADKNARAYLQKFRRSLKRCFKCGNTKMFCLPKRVSIISNKLTNLYFFCQIGGSAKKLQADDYHSRLALLYTLVLAIPIFFSLSLTYLCMVLKSLGASTVILSLFNTVPPRYNEPYVPADQAFVISKFVNVITNFYIKKSFLLIFFFFFVGTDFSERPWIFFYFLIHKNVY